MDRPATGQRGIKASLPYGDSFFTHDAAFYKTLLSMFAVLALQNIITYSVNVADNIMLGVYSQQALSGAAAINQIQFVVQQLTLNGFGEGLVVLSTQHWGKKDTAGLRALTGCAVGAGLLFGFALTTAAFAVPEAMIRIFTDDEPIIQQGVAYLSVIRFTYLPFIITNLLLCALRSIQIVNIAFRLSVMSLLINVGLNWMLIFGRLGMPELGIVGAGIGTLVARCAELAVLLVYIARRSLPVDYSWLGLPAVRIQTMRRYLAVAGPCMVAALLFGSAAALQTAILGHLSADAIAANSVTATIYQYCKMIPNAAAAATAVWIGKTIGQGQYHRIRQDVRTLQVMYLVLSVFVSSLVYFLGNAIVSLYRLTPMALTYARQMILVMSGISAAMCIQMPCLGGIVRGGGDTKFVMLQDIFFCTTVTALSFLAAFVWNWPVWAVLLCLNIEQVCKVFLVAIYKVNSFTWIKPLTD